MDIGRKIAIGLIVCLMVGLGIYNGADAARGIEWSSLAWWDQAEAKADPEPAPAPAPLFSDPPIQDRSGMATSTYLPNSTDGEAWQGWRDGELDPSYDDPRSGGDDSAYISSELDLISVDNDDHVQESDLGGTGGNSWVGHHIKVSPSESAGDVTGISVTVRAAMQSTAPDGLKLAIGRAAASSWVVLDTNTGDEEVKHTLTGSVTTDIADYFDASGDLHIAIWSHGSAPTAGLIDCRLYYAELTVTHDGDGGGGDPVHNPVNDLTATGDPGQVTLEWTDPEDENFSGGGYTVERSTTQGGPYTQIADASGITGTSPGPYEYVDTAVTDGTTYYYIVMRDAGGGDPVESNEASATPGNIMRPDALSLTLGIAGPTVDPNAPFTLTPDPVSLTATVPVHTRTPVVLVPDAAEIATSEPAPTVRLKQRPATLSLTASLPSPTNKLTQTPDAVTLTLSPQTPAEVFPIYLNPSAITLTATLPAAEVTGIPVVIQPAAVSIPITIPAVNANTAIKPAPVSLSLAVQAPDILSTVTRDFRGVFRVPKAGIAAYELYVGTGSTPSTAGTPDETFDALPHTTSSVTLAAPASGSTDYHLVLLRRNQYNLRADLVYERIITVNADGTTDTHIARAPHEVRLTTKAAGAIRATAIWETGDSTASQWAIWWNVGSDPDTTADPDTTVDFRPPSNRWRHLLDTTFGAFDNGDVVHVAVGVRDASSGAQKVAAVQTITADAASGLTTDSDQVTLGEKYRQA